MQLLQNDRTDQVWQQCDDKELQDSITSYPRENFCMLKVEWLHFNYDVSMQEHSADLGFHDQISWEIAMPQH